jgi:phosphohistidine phosphatase SixA
MAWQVAIPDEVRMVHFFQHLAFTVLLSFAAIVPDGVRAEDGTIASWSALRDGGVVLLRHADAPGFGDPTGYRLDDCATQRNLGEAGRKQARGIGERFKAEGIFVGRVLSSQWCRCRDTAELAFPGLVKVEPAFNSFFDDRSKDAAQTAAGRAIIAAWRGPGALVVITHQVNITALTRVVPASGQGVVLKAKVEGFDVVGRISP